MGSVRNALDLLIEYIGEILLVVTLFLAVAIMAAALFGDGMSDRQAAAACLRKGYPDYRIASEWFDQTVYCVRLENGTERVVPLNGE